MLERYIPAARPSPVPLPQPPAPRCHGGRIVEGVRTRLLMAAVPKAFNQWRDAAQRRKRVARSAVCVMQRLAARGLLAAFRHWAGSVAAARTQREIGGMQAEAAAALAAAEFRAAGEAAAAAAERLEAERAAVALEAAEAAEARRRQRHHEGKTGKDGEETSEAEDGHLGLKAQQRGGRQGFKYVSESQSQFLVIELHSNISLLSRCASTRV